MVWGILDSQVARVSEVHSRRAPATSGAPVVRPHIRTLGVKGGDKRHGLPFFETTPTRDHGALGPARRSALGLAV